MIQDNTQHPLSERYQRAEALEQASFTETLVKNAVIYPNWIGNSHCFWYQRSSSKGKQFRVVNASETTNYPVFDHALLASALSTQVKQRVDENHLPISELNIEFLDESVESPSIGHIEFSAFDRRWVYDSNTETCREIPTLPTYCLPSPDGKKAVFLRDSNLWLRETSSGEERALTLDGKRHYAYGTVPERVNLVGGLADSDSPRLPEAIWSPDSKTLLTMRTDERQVLSLPVMLYAADDGDVHPRIIQSKYALPGDEHIARYHMLAIEVDTGQVCEADRPHMADAVLWASPFSGKRAWWSSDSELAYFVDMSRGQTRAQVVAFNTRSGVTRVLFSETADSYIDLNLDFESPASMLPLPDTNELIWFSERSGWAHLYLYDLETGAIKNTITTGEWLVREALYFDAKRREVFFQAAGRVEGRDPYYREVCRANVDTGEISTLASSDEDYVVYKPGNVSVYAMTPFCWGATAESAGVSNNGDHFVTTRTRLDQAPVTELRDRNGVVVMVLETADISGLPKWWQWPEPVKLLAADGKTDIHGLVFKPADFSAEKRYPVLDVAFTNPFYSYVAKGAFSNDPMGNIGYMPAAAYAQLGFVVVMIDGRGSCHRDKAFHDTSYGQLHKGNDLADHVAGIRQLAERNSYMDLERVGIVDINGSNAPIYGLTAFPDFYKVGAVCSTWDARLLTHSETYQGLLPEANYEQSVLCNRIDQLEGKLLLIHGMLDQFYHPSGAFRLIDALVKANKVFDLVMLPNGGHAWDTNHYALRRMWDFLVQHLQGIEPPPHCSLSNGIEFAMEMKQETATQLTQVENTQ